MLGVNQNQFKSNDIKSTFISGFYNNAVVFTLLADLFY